MHRLTRPHDPTHPTSPHRRALCLAMAGLAALATTRPARAQPAVTGYPAKAVKIIVPFSAGAAADTVVRPLAARLGALWGQQVLVDNRGGLTVGPQAAATATPDGYTLLMGAASTMVTTPLAVSRLPYDTRRDFVPITQLVTLPPVLTVHPSLGVKTLKEFLALVKARPGVVNYASSGQGAPNHLGMEYLLALGGGDMVHVPYKGAAPGVVDLVGNQVQAGFNAVPSVLPHIRNGRLLALAVGSRQRCPLLPDVPTVAETLPGFDYIAWYGLFAPRGTPQAVIDKVRTDVARILADPAMVAFLRAEGSEPAPGSAADLAHLMDEETAQWKRVIRDRRISLE